MAHFLDALRRKMDEIALRCNCSVEDVASLLRNYDDIPRLLTNADASAIVKRRRKGMHEVSDEEAEKVLRDILSGRKKEASDDAIRGFVQEHRQGPEQVFLVIVRKSAFFLCLTVSSCVIFRLRIFRLRARC